MTDPPLSDPDGPITQEIRRGESVPHEGHVTLDDVVGMVLADYEAKQRRSLSTVRYPLRHILDHFGANTKAAITGDRVTRYIKARRVQEASTASINMELALLGRAFTLAIRAKRLGPNRWLFIERLPSDETRIRRGFFSREEVDSLCERLPDAIADVVRFLFFSAWRVGEARTLEWRDYDRAEQAIRLRPERSQNHHGRVLPLVGELAAVIERRVQARCSRATGPARC